jgi:hypothetical protein
MHKDPTIRKLEQAASPKTKKNSKTKNKGPCTIGWVEVTTKGGV